MSTTNATMHPNKRVRIERAVNATAPGVIRILPSTATTAVAKVAVTATGTDTYASTGTDTSEDTTSSAAAAATTTAATGETETSHDDTLASSPLLPLSPDFPTITVSPPTPTSPRSPVRIGTTSSSPKAAASEASTTQVVFDPASATAPVVSLPASAPAPVESLLASTLPPVASHPPSPPASLPCKTYHDTGTNTPRLPASSSHFQAIYGRAPTEADRRPLPHKRFTRALEPHEVAYGKMYAAPVPKVEKDQEKEVEKADASSAVPLKRKATYVDSSFQIDEATPPKKAKLSEETTASAQLPKPSSPLKRKATYVDSSFQTDDFPARKKAITGAKVRASLLVKKYSDVASQEGYSVWAEKIDDKVIHSEQVQVKIQFDAHGNVTSGTRTESSKISNVYGEEKKEEKKEIPKPIHSLVPAKRERDTAGDAGGLSKPGQTGYPELDHDSTYDSASEEGVEREAKRMKREDSVGLEEFVVWDPKKEEEKEKIASLRRRVVESMKSAASKAPSDTTATWKKRKSSPPAEPPSNSTTSSSSPKRKRKRDSAHGSTPPPRVRPPRQEFNPYVPRMKREARGTTPAAKRSHDDEGGAQGGKRRRLR